MNINEINDKIKMNGLEEKTFSLLQSIFGTSVEILTQEDVEGISCDFIIPSLSLIVFADGFWHGNDSRQKMSSIAIKKAALEGISEGKPWADKVKYNRAHDRSVNKKLKEAGWRIIRLKEERINASHDKAIGYVSKSISKTIYN